MDICLFNPTDLTQLVPEKTCHMDGTITGIGWNMNNYVNKPKT
jgi:hypothetical protein